MCVLKDLTLDILPGDKIALIGRNGIGKTTFCELICENLKPQSGTIKWGATIERGYFPQNTTEIIKVEERLEENLSGCDNKKERRERSNEWG